MRESWISVKDKLPEPLQMVVTHYENGKMTTDFMHYNGRFCQADIYGKVTHWQPLVPPGEVQKDG